MVDGRGRLRLALSAGYPAGIGRDGTMSAWMVSKDHIDALVVAGMRLRRPGDGPLFWHVGEQAHKLEPETMERVGAMLWAENRRSVNARYTEDEIEDVYTAPRMTFLDVNPVVALKAIACYEYQACETEDWPQSEAHAFCQALRRAAIERLVGYQDAPGWEIDDVRELAWTPAVAR